jgi:hypothetical protein
MLDEQQNIYRLFCPFRFLPNLAGFAYRYAGEIYTGFPSCQ